MKTLTLTKSTIDATPSVLAEIYVDNLGASLIANSFEDLAEHLSEASQGLLDEDGNPYYTYSVVALTKAKAEARFLIEALDREIDKLNEEVSND
jgi:hypothetical protein